MEYLTSFFDFIVHLDRHIGELVTDFGPWVYLIFFAVIFCETGLVVAAFLPGDTLLFALGVISSQGHISPHLAAATAFTAALCGDSSNFHIGRFLGPRLSRRKNSWIIKKDLLHKTKQFYRRYGGKIILIARFIPVLRTMAPFTAGVSGMNYLNFLAFNIPGDIIWAVFFVYSGYFFGELEFVKNNLAVVIPAVLLVAATPFLIRSIYVIWKGK